MQIAYRMLLIHTDEAKSDYKLHWEILEQRHFGETFFASLLHSIITLTLPTPLNGRETKESRCRVYSTGHHALGC